MSVLKLLFKSLFRQKEKESKVNSEPEYMTVTRRGFNITLPKTTYDTLTSLGYTIILSLSNNKPSSVQLLARKNKKQEYRGTLKAMMNVKSFKDGNVCNFKFDNIIRKEK